MASEGTESRFAFGANWLDFGRTVTPAQVEAAELGVARLLGRDDLSGTRFLDIGCGSGLMSLAAHRMGADVVAFDYDADSVRTTSLLRDRFAAADAYRVSQGSVLDPTFMAALGRFDVVYSWGVLHHTGDLWAASAAAADAVASGGALALALYNDQGLASRLWTRVKQAYVEGGPVRRRALVAGCGAYFRSREAAAMLLGRRVEPASPRPRGMDRRHDLVDWVGGYPFEVAKPEEVFTFIKARGFRLEGLRTCGGGLGCNEYLFVHDGAG